MKKFALIGLAVLCLGAVAILYDESNFNAAGRQFQPVPVGHVVGKDNGPGVGTHNPGQQCGSCHTMGGSAEAYLWTMSGTLYADRAGRKVLAGGEVILQDRAGNVISMTSNAAGNFWTAAPIASNPYTVVSHSGVLNILYVLDENGNLVTPADPNDPRTWLYKAWVRNGSSVRPMVTIAPAASATGMYMSCNMHHSPTGSRGALWVSPDPALPSYPAAGLNYSQHILPILNAKCAPCHIPGTTKTRLVTKSDIDTPSTSVDYSCGLDLKNYEGSSTGGVVKRGIRSVVDIGNPAQSLLLNKTVPGAQHGGGAFWDQMGADYLALKQWIAEGAQKSPNAALRAGYLLLLAD
jgi:hypothetical protein